VSGFNYRILIVDDEASVRETAKAVLAACGYETITAVDGFDALVQLRRSLPDIIISDLSMPKMSGFEFLSVVRKRFPHIPVIAVSGTFKGELGGLIADAFFFKGDFDPEGLLTRIRDLIEAGPIRAYAPNPNGAPVWVPVNDMGYFVVTCPECLRSSSIAAQDSLNELREFECPFCVTAIRVLSDKRILKKPPHTRQTA